MGTEVYLIVRVNLSDVISIDVCDRMGDGAKETCNNNPPQAPDVKKFNPHST